MLREKCKSRLVSALERRPGNAFNVEIGQPGDRCLNKRPDHWPANMTGIRWLASGGSVLVFGYCCEPCPLDEE
mgnify:CR=1 FL=1